MVVTLKTSQCKVNKASIINFWFYIIYKDTTKDVLFELNNQ